MSRLAFVVIVALSVRSLGQDGAGRVHDPCIIKADDAYYILSTGLGIPIRRSTDLFTWERAGSVFDSIQPWQRRQVPGTRDHWAPDISYFGGQFHLYYSISTWGKNRSCIAHCTNAALNRADARYRWNDLGVVIASQPEDNFNCIDPNACFDEQGRPWLAFGSFWSGIKLVRLDEKTGMRADNEMYSLAERPKEKAIEAPFIIRRGDWFYLFVSFDQCCQGAASTYRIMVGRSKQLVGPYVDFSGKPLLEGGGTPVLESHGRIRGPGHNAILVEGGRTWLVHHFYDADDHGRAKLQIRPLTFDSDGRPVAGEPISGPAARPVARP
jgi:arabinan endo-1,5-alpha-L-arabinosidase